MSPFIIIATSHCDKLRVSQTLNTGVERQQFGTPLGKRLYPKPLALGNEIHPLYIINASYYTSS